MMMSVDNRVAYLFTNFVLIVGALVALAGPATAAVPAPPVVLCSGAECPTYDVGPVPFTYSWPEEPNTSSSATATPSTLGSVMRSGVAVTLSAGTYGGFTIPTDTDVVAAPGVTINGSVTMGIRSRLTGGGGTVVNGVLHPATDSLVNNVYFQAPVNTISMYFIGTGARFAFINSTITVEGLPDNPQWALFAGDFWTDIVFGNAKVLHNGGRGGPVRLVGMERLVMVDSYFRDNEQGIRINNQEGNPTEDFYFARNTCIDCEFKLTPSSGGPGNWAPTDRAWVHDNNFYRAGGGFSAQVGVDEPNIFNLDMRGNRDYTDSHTGDMGIIIYQTGTVVDNLYQPYQSPPPASRFGAN